METTLTTGSIFLDTEGQFGIIVYQYEPGDRAFTASFFDKIGYFSTSSSLRISEFKKEYPRMVLVDRLPDWMDPFEIPDSVKRGLEAANPLLRLNLF